MKKRLKIGIVAWSMGENAFGVTKPYLDHITRYGDPVPLCPMTGILEELDMIVLPGGKDTYPGLYHAVPGYFNSDPDPYKEYFVQQNLDQYIKKGVPVWGTCLGFQQLVVHFGGKLMQNININTHGHSEEERGRLVHPLFMSPEYHDLEQKLLKKTKIAYKKDEIKRLWTNSLHHQGVYTDDVPDCLEIIATAWRKQGCVEAIKHKTLPIAAMQSHVEEDNSDLGNYLFEELVKIADGRRNQELKEEPVETLAS